jgi:hypothetical protein
LEHDLKVFRNVDIKDWMQGRMSSREFLVLATGLVYTPDSREGWYANEVRADLAEIDRQKQEAEARLKLAEKNAQLSGQPLRMDEVGEQFV